MCVSFIVSWYHGSITRVDAECTLRPLREGSFLVRNCESSRNDFSLSLKYVSIIVNKYLIV